MTKFNLSIPEGTFQGIRAGRPGTGGLRLRMHCGGFFASVSEGNPENRSVQSDLHHPLCGGEIYDSGQYHQKKSGIV